MWSQKTSGMPDVLYNYVVDHIREDELLARLRRETAAMPKSQMQISPDEGQLISFMVKLIGAKKCLEIGVFTGYSSLCTARAMPDDGVLVACDMSEEWTAVARRYWEEAGVASKVDLRLAPALETLDALIADGQGGTFDWAFLDADKENYATYLERCHTLLRAGGVLAVDNVIWSGRVASPEVNDAATVSIRALNDKLVGDERFDHCMIGVADGVTLLRKRG